MDFDPSTFMQATITEALDTRMIPCPVGEYPAQIIDLKAKSGQIGKGDRIGETWAAVEVHWQIEDEAVKRQVARDKVVSRQFIMLDLTPEGMLDLGKGKNLGLGRLREAVGQNVAGQSFSFPMLIGQRAIVKVGQRADQNDSSIFYDEVTGVHKL